MSFFAWQTKYSVGVPEIDRQHKKLFETAARLQEAMLAGGGRESEQAALSELIRYTVGHFRHEEALMRKCGYAGLAAHHQKHEDFTKAVVEFQAKYEAGSLCLSVSMLRFICNWLVEHIGKEDVKIAASIPAGMQPPAPDRAAPLPRVNWPRTSV
jgi:hemerythrin-like metal-binding protein